MLNWKDRNALNIYIIDLLSKYSNIESVGTLERISYDIHSCIEMVISDMLTCGIFDSITPDAYNPQF